MEYFYEIPEDCLSSIHGDIPEEDCYRITRNAPPTQADFCPQLFMVPPMERAVMEPCQYCGASVFTDPKRAIKQMKRFKNLGKYLFSGHIQGDIHGPLSSTTAEYHFNWFQYKAVDPIIIFTEKVHEL